MNKKGKYQPSMRKRYYPPNEPIAWLKRHTRDKGGQLRWRKYQALMPDLEHWDAQMRPWNYPQPKGKFRRWISR